MMLLLSWLIVFIFNHKGFFHSLFPHAHTHTSPILFSSPPPSSPDLSACVSAFVETVSAAANSEDAPALAKALHALADVQARIAKLHFQEVRNNMH